MDSPTEPLQAYRNYWRGAKGRFNSKSLPKESSYSRLPGVLQEVHQKGGRRLQRTDFCGRGGVLSCLRGVSHLHSFVFTNGGRRLQRTDYSGRDNMLYPRGVPGVSHVHSLVFTNGGRRLQRTDYSGRDNMLYPRGVPGVSHVHSLVFTNGGR